MATRAKKPIHPLIKEYRKLSWEQKRGGQPINEKSALIDQVQVSFYHNFNESRYWFAGKRRQPKISPLEADRIISLLVQKFGSDSPVSRAQNLKQDGDFVTVTFGSMISPECDFSRTSFQIVDARKLRSPADTLGRGFVPSNYKQPWIGPVTARSTTMPTYPGLPLIGSMKLSLSAMRLLVYDLVKRDRYLIVQGWIDAKKAGHGGQN